MQNRPMTPVPFVLLTALFFALNACDPVSDIAAPETAAAGQAGEGRMAAAKPADAPAAVAVVGDQAITFN